LKIIWILCAVSVLAVTLARYSPDPGTDIGVFLAYGMLILAFPSSLLVIGLLTLLVMLQDRSGIQFLDALGSNYVSYSLLWLAFFIAGYLQWFALIPFLWRKWKA
jgi:hypothetical protein